MHQSHAFRQVAAVVEVLGREGRQAGATAYTCSSVVVGNLENTESMVCGAQAATAEAAPRHQLYATWLIRHSKHTSVLSSGTSI